MPASLRLQEEFGEDLAVLFVESQGTPPDATETFILEKKWFGNPAMWTNERPFSTGSKGLPNFALVSSDGKVLAKGNHITGDVRDMIEDEVDRAKEGPADTPKKLQKAWKYFGKDKIAKAIAEAKDVGEDPEYTAAAEEAVSEFRRRAESRLGRVEWLLDNGYASRAEERLEDLIDALEDTGELYDRAAELEAKLESDEFEDELDASEKLEKYLEKIFEDPKEDNLYRRLEGVVEDYPDTKAAERARHILSLRG